MVKTTIDIPLEKWKKFSIKVIEEHGGRKKNDVIEELIDKYLDFCREKHKAQAYIIRLVSGSYWNDKPRDSEYHHDASGCTLIARALGRFKTF